MNRPNDTLRRVSVVGMVIAAFLLLDFVALQAFPPGRPYEYLIALVLGACIGQVNLIAAWAALAPGNIAVRVPWSLLLGVFMWYATVCGNRVIHTSYAPGEAVLLGLIILSAIVVAQVPLWIARRRFRWRLVSWLVQATESAQSELQFNLRHLFLGTAFVAIALAPLRTVIPPGNIAIHWEGEMFVVLGAVALSNLVMTVPCIWGAFLPNLFPRAVIGWLIYCGLLTGVEFGLLSGVLGGPGPDVGEMVVVMYLVNVSQCAAVVATLRILRAGFRLLRAHA